MAEPDSIIIGAAVYPNDLADELDLMYRVGRIVEVDLNRNPVEWRVEFADRVSEWFDAEELDVCPSPALSDRD